MSGLVLLAISAQLGLHVRQMDVNTAFLNAPIKEDIWVRMPKGTPLASNDEGIYKLQKSLYGLKQAPREWNNHINDFLIKSGFQRMEAYIGSEPRSGYIGSDTNAVTTIS